MVNTMVDIAVDLMHDIEKSDASQNPILAGRKNRVTASVMREIGFSDREIIEKLGYLPEPFGGALVLEEPEPISPAFALGR